MDVAVGHQPSLTVFGSDYDTFDGTCVRDYVHVLDIADAHIAAMQKIGEGETCRVFNIGTGKGCSVLEVINKTAEVLNKIIPMGTAPRRRPGLPDCRQQQTRRELGYELKHSDLETIVTTAYKQAENFK